MTKRDWFEVLAGAASIGGLIVAVVLGAITWWQNHRTTQLITDGHAATQLTLKDVHATTQDTLKAMHTATQDTLGQLGQVLDRMDRAAEARAQDLKDRLDRGTEA
jgi:hypothetical protein